MATRERTVDRGHRRADRLAHELGAQLRVARVAAGLSQDLVGTAVGVSGTTVGRVERGDARQVSLRLAALIAAVVGLDLVVRAYPGGVRLRDRAHLALLGRLRERLGSGWDWSYEVALAPGDQRAWDASIEAHATGERLVVEAETRLTDVQALLRRISLKRAADPRVRILLLVSDTHANRDVLGAARDIFASAFPMSTRPALRALGAGRIPTMDAIAILCVEP